MIRVRVSWREFAEVQISCIRLCIFCASQTCLVRLEVGWWCWNSAHAFFPKEWMLGEVLCNTFTSWMSSLPKFPHYKELFSQLICLKKIPLKEFPWNLVSNWCSAASTFFIPIFSVSFSLFQALHCSFLDSTTSRAIGPCAFWRWFGPNHVGSQRSLVPAWK